MKNRFTTRLRRAIIGMYRMKGDYIMSPEDFLSSKYREFSIRESPLFNSADRFFQKKFVDENGSCKYFVDVYFYDFTKYNGGGLRWSFVVNFYDATERNIEVSIHGEFNSVSDLEEYIEGLFVKNNFINNPHN